jgi:hypothetical protein
MILQGSHNLLIKFILISPKNKGHRAWPRNRILRAYIITMFSPTQKTNCNFIWIGIRRVYLTSNPLVILGYITERSWLTRNAFTGALASGERLKVYTIGTPVVTSHRKPRAKLSLLYAKASSLVCPGQRRPQTCSHASWFLPHLP